MTSARGASPARIREVGDGVRLVRLIGHREPYPVPVVLVPSLFNRYQVFDLHPRRSMAGFLRDHGLDTWIVDWGEPSRRHPPDLGDYAGVHLRRCLDAIADETGMEGAGLLGYSLGGIIAVITTALHPDRVASLITLAAPIDGWKTGAASLWTRTFPVELATMPLQRIPAWWTLGGFAALSLPHVGRSFRTFAPDLRSPEDRGVLMAIASWLGDGTPLSARTYETLIRSIYRRNALVRGGLEVGGRLVDLADIHCPIMSVAAADDHLCPPRAAFALNRLSSSNDETSIVVPGGHLGAVVGRAARTVLWPRIVDWLEQRSGHEPGEPLRAV